MDFHSNSVVFHPDTVPQSAPISADQVRNNAGGFGWKVDDITRLKRFLCLGSEGGTYYTSQKALTQQNVGCIVNLISEGKGVDVVKTIKQFSLEGRTAKQTSILRALAVCCRSTDLTTKQEAYKALGDICRIPTFLFEFIERCESQGKTTGWGRAHRNAISAWYNRFSDDPVKLAMHVTKYRQRKDWSHRDVLRLSHTKPANEAIGVVLRYAVKGLADAKQMYDKPELESPAIKKVLQFLAVVEEAKSCKEENKMVELIRQHGLVREHIPTSLLSSTTIWKELLQKMPMTAMIRNLGKMTSIGVLTAGCSEEDLVVQKLTDRDSLKQARIHPFNVLVALKTYSAGCGEKGKLTWTPTKRIVKALDDAFYMSFKFALPTKKRYLLAVDVSGSMGCPVMGTPSVSCRSAAAAMMMVTKRTEEPDKSTVVAFCHKLTPLNIKHSDDLDTVTGKISDMNFGGTDCALPMVWAKQKKKMFDVFVVYTDSETWFGNIHPSEALRQYRKWSGLWDARLIVCGMASNEFTIADPDDPGMMDVVGFDSAAPEAMRSFVMGEI
ncbi:RNA-binding protein RO60-like [Haliotis cracherodii]|uniref:RNA-binding protein RO60-like n=1 Tax=Haliotis cracherodii TaxID=6455 RepID=UPI0039E7C58A